jgi:hypothetical protein
VEEVLHGLVDARIVDSAELQRLAEKIARAQSVDAGVKKRKK